jgi:hypothetical protein
MDKQTLIAALDFSRMRLLGTLDAIEKSGQDVNKVLAWRPGPGRAHIGWQFAHCAATHDRYLNIRLKGGNAVDAAYCDAFGGGSTPSDTNVPTAPAIREKLAANLEAFKSYINSLDAEGLARKVTLPNGMIISVAEGALMMVWHESHHQGQIHLTWNLYKAANGVK